jgi:hypothetical protein
VSGAGFMAAKMTCGWGWKLLSGALKQFEGSLLFDPQNARPAAAEFNPFPVAPQMNIHGDFTIWAITK